MPYPRKFKYKGEDGRERVRTVFYTDIRPRKNGVPTGERIRRLIPKVKNMTQAVEAERQIAASILHDKEEETPFLTTFLETTYLEWAKENKSAPHLDEWAVSTLCQSPQFQGRRLDEISVIQVENYKRERRGALTKWKRAFKPGSLNNELAILSRAFRLAVDGGLAKHNPVRQAKRFDLDATPFRVLDRDEEPMLWKALSGGPWYLLPFGKLALLTGMREMEILNLRDSDVDFGRGLLFIRKPKWKKDKRKSEGLPLSDEALEVLRSLCAMAKDGLLFWREEDGRSPVQSTVSNQFRKRARTAGLVGLKPHSLHHTFGSRLGEAGRSPYEIARLMGHAQIQTSMVYVHTQTLRLREALEAVSCKQGHSVDTRKTGTGD